MRRPLSLLFIVMLAVRSLLPAGFMLGTSTHDGAVSVVICTSQGAKTILLDADDQPAEHDPATAHADLCPYAASAPVALGAAEPPAVGTTVRYAAVAYDRAIAAAGPERCRRRLGARPANVPGLGSVPN